MVAPERPPPGAMPVERPAPDVRGADHDQAAFPQPRRSLTEHANRVWHMLDDVPQRDHIERSGQRRMIERAVEDRFEAKSFAGVFAGARVELDSPRIPA